MIATESVQEVEEPWKSRRVRIEVPENRSPLNRSPRDLVDLAARDEQLGWNLDPLSPQGQAVALEIQNPVGRRQEANQRNGPFGF